MSVQRKVTGGILAGKILGTWVRVQIQRRKTPFAQMLSSGITPDSPSPAQDAPAPSQNAPAPTTIYKAFRIATWGPLRSTCLVRAVVLARTFKRYGYPATVVIGLPNERAPDDPWLAHAWVELPSGPMEDTSNFRPMARFQP